jgi:superfamily II DNA or RNA helicase
MATSAKYIYVRVHESYEKYDVCKIGQTSNIPDRDKTYATGEVKRGRFIMVFQIISECCIVKIEGLLKTMFIAHNIVFDGGTEFYKNNIMVLLEPIFNNLNIEYIKLTDDEIENLTRKTKPNLPIVITNNTDTIYTPREYQQTIIDNAVSYYANNNKGLLVLTCGIGKTLLSLWIAKELQANTILIGVPNLLLLKQWKNTCLALFVNTPCLIVCDTRTVEYIDKFMKENKRFIIITTYSSAYKVNKVSKRILSFTFDMKINDECHHLTALHTDDNREDDEGKQFIKMLDIPSIKQISLTATPKHVSDDTCGTSISNDNREFFGDIIDSRNMLWAIHKDIICDYVIQTIITKEEQFEQHLATFNITDENDKRLFLSAFASLKSIATGHSHHLLIYSNNTANSLKISKYITMLLDNLYFTVRDLYYSTYNGKMDAKEQTEVINNFANAQVGIISCVYCLGEGWDFPLLDAVVFAENMTSNIRIVQSALRASRKDKNNNGKKAKIILPILSSVDWLDNNENNDLKKVREVIYQLGLEDETIIQKIKAYKIAFEKQNKKDDNGYCYGDDGDREYEYDEELTSQLRLKTIPRIALDITYAKAKKIIAEKQCKSKEQYIVLCEKDARLSAEPEELYKTQFTSWVDYLSIDRIYYDLETCKNKINKYISVLKKADSVDKVDYLDISIICKELCNTDALFPPVGLWVDYYNVKSLRDIIILSPQNKKKGIL